MNHHLLANFMKRFFGHYLPVQKGLSVNTMQAYRDAVKLLLCFTADMIGRPVDRLTVEDITEKVVTAFLDYVERQRGCSANTRNARLAAIHSLFAFIAREEPVLLPQCQRIRAIPLKRTRHERLTTWKRKKCRPSSMPWISLPGQVSVTGSCFCCFTTPGLESVKSSRSSSPICV